MSQPPPPPNQPPSGGFGAPQEPSPGQPSYGYPQQPPQGGYGYPQQSPGQPPQGPPSGGGFGAPQQPPFGTPPTQPPGMYPGMPPGGPGKPGGGNNNTKVAAIVAVAVVLVLAIGVGGWFVMSGSDDDTGGTEASSTSGGGGGTSERGSDDDASGTSGSGGEDAKQVVDLKAPKVNDVTTVSGGWLAGDVFAKSSAGEIIGTDVKTGKQAWKIPLKGAICAASPQKTADNKVGLVLKDSNSTTAKCTRMAVADLDAHKLAWDKPLPDANTSISDNVTISGDTVAATWSGGWAGFKISSGKQIWQAKSDSECRDVGYAGGEKLYAVVQCGSYTKGKFSVEELNASTGKSKGKFEVPDGVQTVRVASTDPLVIVVGAGESTPTDVMTVEDNKLKGRISLGDRYNKPCGTEIESCYGMAVGDDAVYLSTKEHSGSSDYGRTNEIMAFDFDTGKTKWKSDAGGDRKIMPFKAEDDKVLGYKLPGYDAGGEVVSVDPESGKQTTLLRMPTSRVGYGEQAIPMSTYSVKQPIVFEDNKLFLQEKLVSQRSSSGAERRLAVGFGAE